MFLSVLGKRAGYANKYLFYVGELTVSEAYMLWKP
jgi:hypothetical protein